MSNPIMPEQESLHKKLGEIVSVAIVNMVQQGRWYVNWRTRDEEEQWTKENFHLIERDQIGTIGFAAIDVVNEIETEVLHLIEQDRERAVAEAEIKLRHQIASEAPAADDEDIEHYNSYIRNIWQNWAVKNNAKLPQERSEHHE